MTCVFIASPPSSSNAFFEAMLPDVSLSAMSHRAGAGFFKISLPE